MEKKLRAGDEKANELVTRQYHKFNNGILETADSIVPMYLRKSQAERMRDLK